MSINKDIYDEIHDEYIGEDDIVDKIHDEYIEEDKIVNKSLKGNDTKAEDYLHIEESKIFINCKLKVDFDKKNKMIYLYPGKSQYFTADVSKCCGDVTIKYKDCYPSKGICGNLGIYRI